MLLDSAAIDSTMSSWVARTCMLMGCPQLSSMMVKDKELGVYEDERSASILNSRRSVSFAVTVKSIGSVEGLLDRVTSYQGLTLVHFSAERKHFS